MTQTVPERGQAETAFARAVPSVPLASRAAAVARHQAGDLALTAAGRIPGLRRLADRPRLQPMRSSSVRLFTWGRSPYGTDHKPASLAEIPWDYVEARQDDIPFLGLREYWYPALHASRLRHNTPVPITLLGDNLVLFRDAHGRARALENRCPHRSALLSLGQVGVVEPGTLTCRYHGMTFDGSGRCVAYIADGPDSPAVGKVRARAYPVEEHGGVVWVYMGDATNPAGLLDAQPHARSVLRQPGLVARAGLMPYNHLNQLDNATDLAHVGCLHRTCLVFGDQKPHGEVDHEVLPDGGLRAHYRRPGEHAGQFHIDSITWYLPNLVYHSAGELGGGLGEGWFWFVPRDIASFTAWMMVGPDSSGGPVSRAASVAMTGLMLRLLFADRLGPHTLMSCLLAGDAPMQASQGRVVRWDTERLTRPDRSVSQARKIMCAAHRAEVARRAAGNGRPTRRLARPDRPPLPPREASAP